MTLKERIRILESEIELLNLYYENYKTQISYNSKELWNFHIIIKQIELTAMTKIEMEEELK